MYLRRASRLWLALMLSIAGFGAAAGAAGTGTKSSPLADAVQHRDKQAVLTLLPSCVAVGLLALIAGIAGPHPKMAMPRSFNSC